MWKYIQLLLLGLLIPAMSGCGGGSSSGGGGERYDPEIAMSASCLFVGCDYTFSWKDSHGDISTVFQRFRHPSSGFTKTYSWRAANKRISGKSGTLHDRFSSNAGVPYIPGHWIMEIWVVDAQGNRSNVITFTHDAKLETIGDLELPIFMD